MSQWPQGLLLVGAHLLDPAISHPSLIAVRFYPSSWCPYSPTEPRIIKIREKPWMMAAISMKHRTVVRKLN